MNPQAVNENIKEGTVLAGKYRVERVLKAGGMGVVVAAHHLQLDERVALKFLLPESLESPEAVARFEREARAAVKIKSEHVARVIDVSRLEDGAPYMVMEYLEGQDLGAMLKARGPLPVEQAVEFVLQASEAIAEAHALGIVHRDLKPANLFCIRRADDTLSIKVLDFGISKTAGAGHEMTQSQTVLGSPFYMSPEQIQSSRTVDARADIWSLGIILFELVTRRVPFRGEHLPELVLKIMTAPAPSLSTLRKDAPPALEAVIARCLEKDREKRFANVSELAIALLPVAPPSSKASVDRITRVLQSAARAQGSSGVPDQPSSEPTAENATRLEKSASQTAIGLGEPPIQASLTSASWGRTNGIHVSVPAPPRRGPRSVIAVAVIATLVGGLLLLGGAFVWKRSDVTTATQSSDSAATMPATAVSVPPTATEVASAPTPSAPTVETAAVASSLPTPPKAPSSAVPRAPVTKAAGPAVTAVAKPPGPTANCNPPFIFDAEGNKRFKPECM